MITIRVEGTQYHLTGSPLSGDDWALWYPDPDDLKNDRIQTYGKLEKLLSDVRAACFLPCARCGGDTLRHRLTYGKCLGCLLMEQEEKKDEQVA